MALKNKRKWIILSILIVVALVIFIAFAWARPTPESSLSSETSSKNASSKPEYKGGGLGNGTLYVYVDKGRTTEAPTTDHSEKYLVIYGRLYYFKIAGITEYSEGQAIHVWANYSESDYLIGTYTIGPGGTINFNWTIPTLPYGTEIKYKYGLNLTGPNPSWRFAHRTTHGVGITLVIPQVPLGVLGATSAVIVAYGLKALTSKKRFFSK
jgi:hypothetical protein